MRPAITAGEHMAMKIGKSHAGRIGAERRRLTVDKEAALQERALSLWLRRGEAKLNCAMYEHANAAAIP